jgi:tetratricopeptide (TPR) repeat protein
LAAGERLAEVGFQIGQEAGQSDAALVYGGQLIFIRTYQGRGDEVIEMLEQSASAFAGVPAFRAGLAQVLAVLGRDEEATQILEDAASDRFEHVASVLTMLGTLAYYADAAARTRKSNAAAALYERMTPFSDQVVWLNTQGLGHARLWLGLLADALDKDHEAVEHLRFACEFHHANDMPLWEARGELGWAELLARRGDTADAREHAKRALELSREHGYGLFEPPAAALVAESVAEA